MVDSYDHTQYGFLHYLLVFSGVTVLMMGIVTGEDNPPSFYGCIALSALTFLFAGCFAYLRVSDAGDALSLQFGPIGIFRRRIAYRDVERVEVSRTRFWDGWGIHGFPFDGLTYNIKGFRCVRVTLKRPSGLWRFKYINIGTDDPEGLAAFLKSRIQPPNEAERSPSL